MTKSIIAERKKHKTDETYEQQVAKFLGEFGVKDSRSLTTQQHQTLMLTHFYWVDKEDNQGYHISEDIEDEKRKLTTEELAIYELMYYDATMY
jgi:hypothetical protein